MYCDEQLKLQAQVVADEFAKAYNKKHKLKVKVPVKLTFDLEMKSLKSARCGATASVVQGVSINMTLFRDYPRDFLNIYIPHEMAHMAQFSAQMSKRIKHTGGGHGWLWRSMMVTMKQPPEKFHTMDVTKSINVFKASKKKSNEPLLVPID